MKRSVICICAALSFFGSVTIAQAETTVLSEACNKTDVSTVWFEALYATVTLTATAEDLEDYTTVSRQLTFPDGRVVAFQNGNNFLYDAADISCDTYIAVAKSSVLYSLASGHRYTHDLHEDYKAILRGENPCVSADQSEACIVQNLDVLYAETFSEAQMTAFEAENPAILTIRNHPFGLSTYALNLESLALTLLFYEGT